jgi:hypothetical protein
MADLNELGSQSPWNMNDINQLMDSMNFDKVSHIKPISKEFREDPVIDEFIRSVSPPMIKSADKMGPS